MENTKRQVAQEEGTKELTMSVDAFVHYTAMALRDEFELASMDVKGTAITVEFTTGEQFTLEVSKR